MVDIFNRLGMQGGLNATLPAPAPAPSASQGAFDGLMGNFAPPAPSAPNPQGAFGGLMSNFPSPAPQAPPLPLDMQMHIGPTKEEQFLIQCGIPPQVAQNMAGGNDRVGYRTANGDAGLQGANMPQPMSPMLPMSPATFDSSGPMQMPSAPFQSGMRAGSVGNQMGGLNNMYSNFAAPSPMPAPPPPMFGAPAGNSRAMMGPKPVGLF
jgi:hypothetical protein